jgi:hypothetical protein
MRVELKIEGGIAYFPGLSKPRALESDKLSKEDAAELERLANAAHFFDLPTRVGAVQEGAADYRQYIVTMAEGWRSHTVRLVDPIEDTQLQLLLEFVKSRL